MCKPLTKDSGKERVHTLEKERREFKGQRHWKERTKTTTYLLVVQGRCTKASLIGGRVREGWGASKWAQQKGSPSGNLLGQQTNVAQKGLKHTRF